MSDHRSDIDHGWQSRVRLALALVGMALAWPLIAQTPLPDLCGCRNHPASLGAFDTRTTSTWPPGTTLASGRTITVPLPPDGVLVFDSLHIESNPAVTTSGLADLTFLRNAANTPVTILVKGNVTIAGNGALLVRGNVGGNGTTNASGAGGLGSFGGFRGGDGAFQLANLASDGGFGLGPGGGRGATAVPLTGGGAATFVGGADLLPLIGGSGGGGGRSTTLATNCSAPGGGGGGGAVLIAANGTITLSNTSGSIIADGGNSGTGLLSACAGATGGAGGAIRLIANTIAGGGRLFARGGTRWEDAVPSGDGVIRLEAVINTLGVTLTDPLASRSSTPGAIVNPFTPRVAVTAVAGQAVSETPGGVFGGVDVQIPTPGPKAIDLATEGVPTGTIVEVKVKPRLGVASIAQNVTLTNCNAAGSCLASVTIDLAAGVYTIEARATFQLPSP